MKFLAVILSFIVLGLSAAPCIDDMKDGSPQKIETSHNGNNNHQNETDHCSPFCTCQCCQSTFYVSDFIAVFQREYFETIYFEYSSSFLSIDLCDILIPPKS
ncbi:MAG: hypothetical protein M0R16_10340 [Bacteroidales bacterium]|jgi:hypothetical protein|nr:hypothetical protein [Bacteroidales bacterium]